jgi:hypothetical protein
MADIKALKDAVWLKKQEVLKEEGKLAEWEGVVSFVECDVLHSTDIGNR